MARILIVDDERDVVTILKFLLEKDGHAVDVAYDGREALAALGVEPADAAKTVPDLVILDVLMPELGGYAACARMFADPRTKRVPVLMLTAKGEMGDPNAFAPNVAAHIGKPFDPRALRERIKDLLGGGGR